MPTLLFSGTKFIFGVPQEIKPLLSAPPGRIRIRLRPNLPGCAFLRTPKSIKKYYLKDCGTHWTLLDLSPVGANLKVTQELLELPCNGMKQFVNPQTNGVIREGDFTHDQLYRIAEALK